MQNLRDRSLFLPPTLLPPFGKKRPPQSRKYGRPFCDKLFFDSSRREQSLGERAKGERRRTEKGTIAGDGKNEEPGENKNIVKTL